MMGNFEYFSRRMQQEQAAATSASDPQARRVHLEMAQRYAELVTSGDNRRHLAAGDFLSAA